jgi:hypothetical protein
MLPMNPEAVYITLRNDANPNLFESFVITYPTNEGLHVIHRKMNTDGYYDAEHTVLHHNQTLMNYVRLVALAALAGKDSWTTIDIVFPAYPRMILSMESLENLATQDLILEIAALVEMVWLS